MMALQLQLTNIDNFDSIRPINDDGWKGILPECIDKMVIKNLPDDKKFTRRFGKKAPETNPLWDAGLDDEQIHTRVTALFPTMAQQPVKLMADRRDPCPAVRALVVTNSHWSLASKAHSRDWCRVASWAVIEEVISLSYRGKLLMDGPANSVRRQLASLLQPFVVNQQQILTAGGGMQVDLSFPWWDLIVAPAPQQDDSVPNALDAAMVGKLLTLEEQVSRDFKEIQRLIKSIERSYAARNNLGPKGSIDQKVSMAVDNLVLVISSRHSPRCASDSYYSRHSRITHSASASGCRTVMMQSVT